MLGPFNCCKHNCMYLCLRLSFFVTMAQKDNHEWMHTNFSVKSNHCRRHGCHKSHERDYLLHLKSITYIRKINYFILTPHNCCDHCWIKTSVYCSFQNVTSDSASTKVISPSGHNICTFRQGLANNLQSAKRANGLTDEQLNLYYFITTICLKKK